MLVFARRGLRSLLEQRFVRIAMPLAIAVAMIVPLDTARKRFAHRTIRPEPAIAEIFTGDEAAVRRRLAAPGAAADKDRFYCRTPLGWSRVLSSERLRLRVTSWSLHLIQTNVFDHLSFLWFLCWLVAIFALLAVTGLLPTGRRRWWRVAASCLPQAVMGMSLAGFYGPDTAFGLLPKPPVLGFYACFFFGVATFAAEGRDTRIGRHWKLLRRCCSWPGLRR